MKSQSGFGAGRLNRSGLTTLMFNPTYSPTDGPINFCDFNEKRNLPIVFNWEPPFNASLVGDLQGLTILQL